MKTMKGIITQGNGTVELKELAIPEINDYQMMVKMKAVSICASDIGLINGTLPKFVKKDEYPIFLGHECVGEVVKTGCKVKNYQTGDLVVCNPTNYDDPIDGNAIFWAGFAEYGAVHDYRAMKDDGYEDWADYTGVMKLPAGFDPVTSTIIYTLREPFNAARLFGFKKEQSVVIYGAGAVGKGFIKTCRLMGMYPIISVETQEERLKDALNAGADYAFDPTKTDIREEVFKICPEGADHTVDAAGVPALINDGLKLIKDGGDVNIFAEGPQNNVNLDWGEAPLNFNINFKQMVVDPGDLESEKFVLDAIESGEIKCSDYISDVFELKDYKEAFDLALSRKNKGKVVLKFE